jgi:hypothetical protein
MKEKLRFLGLDVHAETIAVAVAEPDGEVRSLGTIANREESIRKFIKKVGPAEQLRACYEAGPTAFVLYWLETAQTAAGPVLEKQQNEPKRQKQPHRLADVDWDLALAESRVMIREGCWDAAR